MNLQKSFCGYITGFPGGSDGKESIRLPIQETRVRFLGQLDPLEGGHGNPLQYSCLGSPMDGEAWRATVYGVTEESDTTEQLTLHGLPWWPSG